jgi:hypothetical protein
LISGNHGVLEQKVKLYALPFLGSKKKKNRLIAAIPAGKLSLE